VPAPGRLVPAAWEPARHCPSPVTASPVKAGYSKLALSPAEALELRAVLREALRDAGEAAERDHEWRRALTERVAAACQAALRSGEELQEAQCELGSLREALALQTRRAEAAEHRAAAAEAALKEAKKQRRVLHEQLETRLQRVAAGLETNDGDQ